MFETTKIPTTVPIQDEVISPTIVVEPDTETELEEKKNEVVLPVWYQDFAFRVSQGEGFSAAIEHFAELSKEQLNEILGGEISELPYEVLRTLLPDGSDHLEVGAILRKAREKYLITHPEEMQGRGAAEGVIGYNGMFFPKKVFDEMTGAQRFAILVGPTCFHYNTDVPGYGYDEIPREEFLAHIAKLSTSTSSTSNPTNSELSSGNPAQDQQ